MTIIMSMLRRLKEVYPEKMVSIEHDHAIYSSGEEIIRWNLYVQDVVSAEYLDFTVMVNAINKLTNTMTHIIIINNRTDEQKETTWNHADGKCNPYEDWKKIGTGYENRNWTGD